VNTLDTDVLVVGGGTGGVAAAIAAARAGARVTVIEQEPIIGGTITGSYVTMPCGGPRTGLYKQMLDRLHARYPLRAGPNWFLPSSWLAVMNSMLAEEKVRVLCGVHNIAPLLEEAGGRSRVVGAIWPVRGGEQRIRAGVTIDATGTGACAEAAGCETRYGTDAKTDFNEPLAPPARSEFVQHCTWMYISQKMGCVPAFDMTRLSINGTLEASLGWVRDNPKESLRRDAGIYLHWGSAVACRDTRNPDALADAQGAARVAMQPDIDLLHENGYAVYLAPRLGVREVRRVLGEHVISECDLRSQKLPDDAIAIGNYSLDLWGGGLKWGEQTRLPTFGIPYRSLVPRNVDGLLLAGKSISGTHIAMSAYRVQPILATYSQAAGVAAAWCASHEAQPREADVPALRAMLTRPEQSVILEEKT
jgi:hypothetical protein